MKTGIKILLLECILLISLTIVLVMLAMLVNYRTDNLLEKRTREFILKEVEKMIKTYSSFKVCKLPHLPVNSTEISQFNEEVPPIDCSSVDINWVTCENSQCTIQEQAKEQYGRINCTFTDLIRQSDYEITEGDTSISDAYYKLEKSDIVKVSCKSEKGNTWNGTLTGIRIDKGIWNRTGWNLLPPDALKLNVLMFAIDSISRNTFVRKLPKSYDYLTKTLKTHILQGYNIVGDGTTHALIPILTGHSELELPDTRKRFIISNYVNVYPFIWNDYKDAGYVTGFLEDAQSGGIFLHRMRGFNAAPTDHYMQSYYVASAKEWSRGPRLCAGSIPRHKVMMNHIKHFFSVYKEKPKFIFGFQDELSHDSYNLIQAADDDLHQFLKDLHDGGVLQDTLLIIMADHGHRFGSIRNTIQGKQEERLPFFSFTFPNRFKKEHKKAYYNFVNNINKLTTPFDIYATLKSVLHLGTTDTANLEQRSISLFSKIPPERSCGHAHIEPHWCACLEWFSVPLSNPIVVQLGKILVNTLNNYTSTHRELCAVLSISKILWVTKMRPNEHLIKFKYQKDYDAYYAKMSTKRRIKSEIYQIKALLTPGNSLFEVSVTHFLDSNHLQLKLSDISRTNMYRSQAKCIEKTYPDLRKYCYCKD